MLKLTKKIFIAFVFVFLITLDGHASDHNINFKDFSFWRMMEGYWEAKNTYFDSDMNYIIRSYSSLIVIKLDNKNYFEKDFSKLIIKHNKKVRNAIIENQIVNMKSNLVIYVYFFYKFLRIFRSS